MWTQFFDMSSGGSEKLDHDVIFIEADEAQAEFVFQERFGRDPHNVTCQCCGPDYSVHEVDKPESEFAKNPLIIPADQLWSHRQ